MKKCGIYFLHKIARVRIKLHHLDSSYYTACDKIKALLEIIILCAIFKSSREPLECLFLPSISGRQIFRGIMTHKPVKYGIKTMGLADSHNAYIYNAYTYTSRGRK